MLDKILSGLSLCLTEIYRPDLKQRRGLHRHCALHCALQKLSR